MTTPLPVIISPNAADDLTASWVWLRDRNPRTADEWLAGNHARFSRFDDEPTLRNWDAFLNVLNVETENGATGADLRRVLFGPPNPKGHFDDILSSLYIQVLRPLCWAGLLHMDRAKGPLSTERSAFIKTPLWRAVLRLETDRLLRIATRH